MEKISYDLIIFGIIALFLGIKLFSILGKNPIKLAKKAPNENKLTISILNKNDKFISFKLIDPKFDEATFLKGAKDAFIMIFKAFAESDYIALKNLLNYDIYEAYVKSIGLRDANYKPVLIKTIKEAIITENHLDSSNAFITVKFNYHAESEGKTYINQSDTWTFTRNLNSSNTTWQVVETK